MKEIEEKKSIAEFMNLPMVDCKIGTENGTVTKGYLHPSMDMPISPEGLQYKYCWKWLMPVVEKIEGLKPKNNSSTRFQFEIRGKTCQVIDKFKIEKEDFLNLYYKVYDTKKEATYKAVVEFIKWYNSHEL